MKSLSIKLLILFGATGLLPWVAFFIGQVSSRVAIYAHIAGVSAVLLMKIYDLLKNRSSVKTVDDKGSSAVNGSDSDLPPAA